MLGSSGLQLEEGFRKFPFLQVLDQSWLAECKLSLGFIGLFVSNKTQIFFQLSLSETYTSFCMDH